MPQVTTTVVLVNLSAANGATIPSVRMVCDKCGHCVESYGQRGRSIRRCLALMREGCPRREKNNFYKTNPKLHEQP